MPDLSYGLSFYQQTINYVVSGQHPTL
ncbi:hypothetical protein CEX35_15070 [Salmonella enterica]|nr:hypothetical protein [Salmonella enterica]